MIDPRKKLRRLFVRRIRKEEWFSRITKSGYCQTHEHREFITRAKHPQSIVGTPAGAKAIRKPGFERQTRKHFIGHTSETGKHYRIAIPDHCRRNLFVECRPP